MNSKKKFLALLLAIALTATFITSCDTLGAGADASEIIELAEGKLASSVYTVNVSTAFETEDEDIKSTVSTLEAATISYTKNGENFIISMNTSVGGFSIDKSYTVIDNTLYHKSTATSADKSVTAKEKAEIGLTERTMLISKAGVAASITADDFAKAKAAKSENGYTVTCTEIKDDSLAGLCTVLASSFKGTDATVLVSDVGYTVEIENGAFSKTTLNCTYKITMNGTEYDLNMTVTSSYDFMNAPAIKIPTDVAEYADTAYNKIVK